MLLNNRYRVLQTLGGGGFGDTFLAEDTQMPSLRRCVIKQLKLIHNNPDVYQLVQGRFQREAAILEELGDKCTQIPTLYAYFQEDGKFYLVQEWIQGDTLSECVQKQGVFSETAIRNLLLDLLPVLDTIHARGIIHRDIKPDNIILRRSYSGSPDEKPVLIDFGAVRESMGTVVNSQGSPTSSIVIGTPGYMPSEQAMGRPVYVSDIYSLGITVIYLLTGKQPHELPTDPRTGELVWYNYAPSLSPPMRAILEKATAYHPRDRYNHAQDMLYALKNYQVGSIPTTASQPAISSPTPPVYSPSPTTNPTIPVIPNTPIHPPTPVNQYPNTISSPQVTANNNQKIVIVSGIIAAGLIGAAGIISFALNREPKLEQASQQPVQENRLLNPTDSPTPSPTQETTVTTRSIPTSSIPTRERSSSRIENPTTESSSVAPVTPESITDGQTTTINPENQTPTDQIPTNQTPNNQTPTNQTPTNQDTQTQNPAIETTPTTNPETTTNTPDSSPTDFVQSYYSSINSGNLETAWNKLSPSFRSNRKLHPQGYKSYIDWWGNQVANVQVNQIRLIENNDSTAVIDANLNYQLKSGKQSPSDVRFYLVWDTRDRRWIIRDAQRLRG